MNWEQAKKKIANKLQNFSLEVKLHLSSEVEFLFNVYYLIMSSMSSTLLDARCGKIYVILEDDNTAWHESNHTEILV